MLQTMVRIVFSILLVFNVLNAIEVPIVKFMDVNIPLKKFSVIEFPFEIKDKDFSAFVYKIKIKNGKNISDSNNKKDDIVTPSIELNNSKDSAKTKQEKMKELMKKKLSALKKGKTVPTAAKSPIRVSFGKNFVKLFPKKLGSTQMIIWGYNKFPIMLTLHVVKNKEKSHRYIKFIDYRTDLENAKNFETSNDHDKIISRIIKALYNNKKIPGYKILSDQKEYNSGGMNISLIREYIGRNYVGSAWRVTNLTDKRIEFHEETFATNRVYAVSFVNNILPPKTSTKMFVVYKK